MKPDEIEKLADELAKHLPCTVASIADALRKATAPKENAAKPE